MGKSKNTLKKLICIVVVLSLSLANTLTAIATSETISLQEQVNEIIKKSTVYMKNTVEDPVVSSIGGEWAVIALARSGENVSKDYYEKYYTNAVNTLKENNGVLSKTKYTEYSRMILALTSIGKDVKNVGGDNLLEKLSDFENVKKQGITGPVFALIALDSKGYEIPVKADAKVQNTRQIMIDYILADEVTDSQGQKGGFSLGADYADPDVTGMVLQALAPYKNQAEVKGAIDRALLSLEKIEMTNGGYKTWGEETSESVVQVVIAKCALGIDPKKNVEALLSYHLGDGSFRHTPSGEVNQMACEQCLYALDAYKRFSSGQKRLYDMTDVSIDSQKNDETIKATLNGKAIPFTQPPVNLNGRVLVPMRAIFEAMGADIEWEGTTKKVTGTLDDKNIILFVGNKEAKVNDQIKMLDVAPAIINSTTMVPVRFVSESLDAEVTWSKETNTVVIVK